MEAEPTPLKLILLLLSFSLLAFPASTKPNQATTLGELINSRKSSNPPSSEPWEVTSQDKVDEQVYIGPQDGLKDADKIEALPGQPKGVDFDQYAGYVTVDPKNGRALFYYLVESPQDSKSKPLVLWLNGGPGCSSLGYGAMEELGPFRVNSDGKSLYRNIYSWNKVANVIFLESPAGVGFSYSNTSSDYVTGDKKTAEDAYTFLVNWLERFPQYKNRDFFITGESYAGHFVPQLAYKIISYKNIKINLKGIAIGNAWIDDSTGTRGRYDYLWTHAMISDETIAGINKYCDFRGGNISSTCVTYLQQGSNEVGDIDPYNIYAPLCKQSEQRSSSPSEQRSSSTSTVKEFDPCSDIYIESYLNLDSVQTALHARATNWISCGGQLTGWTDSPTTILPTITHLMANGIRVWIYSGDVDAVVSVTASRYAINTLGVQIERVWHPWYSSQEVGGYVVGYKGLTFATIRGAGHEVPSYQPEQALTMISSFINGTLPPSS